MAGPACPATLFLRAPCTCPDGRHRGQLFAPGQRVQVLGEGRYYFRRGRVVSTHRSGTVIVLLDDVAIDLAFAESELTDLRGPTDGPRRYG